MVPQSFPYEAPNDVSINFRSTAINFEEDLLTDLLEHLKI